MHKSAMVALTILLGGHNPAHAVCSAVAWWIPYWGVNTSTNLLVSSGEACPLGGDTGGSSIIESMTISSPPRNGTARVGDGQVIYQSQPGFTGQDAFSFSVTGSGRGGSGTSTVQVNVTVQ